MAEQRKLNGTEYTPQNAAALTVSGGATPTNTSASIDVSDAVSLTLQVRNTDSTSLLIEVFTSPDDSVYDDKALASMVVTANQEATLLISPGVNYLRVKASNQDAANATVVTSKLSKKS